MQPISQENHFVYIDLLTHQKDRLFPTVKYGGNTIDAIDFIQIDKTRKKLVFFPVFMQRLQSIVIVCSSPLQFWQDDKKLATVVHQ